MLYRALARQADKAPDRIAVVGEQRSFTFRQLLHEVEKNAAFLKSLGIKTEDRLLVGIPPSPEFYSFFYAAAAVGATVIPVLPSGKIPPQLQKTGPLLAVGNREFLNASLKSCSSLKNTILWERKDGLQVPETKDPFTRKRLIQNEQVVAVSSSGTTGSPTVTFQSARLLLERGSLKGDVVGVTCDDVLYSSRPFNNGSSINNHVMVPLVKGCKVVVHEKFERFKAAQAIATEKVTILYAVAFVFELLASIPSSYALDFSSVRLCISGGGPLSKYVYDRFYERFGIRIRQRYGATQIIPAFTYSLSGTPGAVGQVSGPFPVAIVNGCGEELEPEEIREVVFDVSKFATRWKKWFKNNPYRRGKYIYTGDLGRTDPEGNLYIVGRKSSFIKVGSNRVEAAEVESVLRTHPQVKEVSVFALRLGQSDEAVGAVVVPAGRVSVKELLGYCAQQLDSYKCPREIEFRRRLPRNAHGKVIPQLFESEMF